MNFHPARLATEKAVFRPALPTCFVSGITGMHMGNLTYSEQLKHPNWQRKRLEMLSEADFTCQSCFSKEQTLHVHHKQYFKGRKAWEYSNDELAVLCEVCHEGEHESSDLLKESLASLPASGPGCLSDVVGMVSGYVEGFTSAKFERHFEANPQMFLVGAIANSLSDCDSKKNLYEFCYLLAGLDQQKKRDFVENMIALLKDECNA